MATQDLKGHAFGGFYDRPLEYNMSRLVELWQLSQPLHIRHLAIVRDSAITNKIAHFVHYTYEHFKSMVEDGQKFWEAVETIKQNNMENKKPHQSSTIAANAVPELDDYGFPKLDSSQFQGHNNDATLSECIQAAKIRPFTLTGKDPVVVKSAEGAHRKRSEQCIILLNFNIHVDVSWSRQYKHRIIKKQHAKSQTVQKRVGRPRKFSSSALFEITDTLTPEQAARISKSEKAAMRYQKRKTERHAKGRVEDGGCEDEVSDVIPSQDAVQRRSDGVSNEGLLAITTPVKKGRPRSRITEPTENTMDPVRPVIEKSGLQSASLPQARPLANVQTIHSLISNLPSVAAHTARIPLLAQKPPTPSPKNKGGRPRKLRSVLGYFPSVVAHTTFDPHSVPIRKRVTVLSRKSPSKRQDKEIKAVSERAPLTSIATLKDDDFSLPGSTDLSSPLIADSKRSRKRSAKAAELDLHHVTAKKPRRQGKIVKTSIEYVPSIAAHTQPVLKHTSPTATDSEPLFLASKDPELRRKSTKAAQPVINYDAAPLKVVKNTPRERTRGSKTYQQYADTVRRESSGVYVCELGRVYHGKQGCPPKARLIIFKSPRLVDFEWFTEEMSSAPITPSSGSIQAGILAAPSQLTEDVTRSGIVPSRSAALETLPVPSLPEKTSPLDRAAQTELKSGANLPENNVSSGTSLAGTKRKRNASSMVNRRPPPGKAFSTSSPITQAQTDIEQNPPEPMSDVINQPPLAQGLSNKEFGAATNAVSQSLSEDRNSQRDRDAQFVIDGSHSQQLVLNEPIEPKSSELRNSVRVNRLTRKQQGRKTKSKAQGSLSISTAEPVRTNPLPSEPSTSSQDILPLAQQFPDVSLHECAPAVLADNLIQHLSLPSMIDKGKEPEYPPKTSVETDFRSPQTRVDIQLSSENRQQNENSLESPQPILATVTPKPLNRSPLEQADVRESSDRDELGDADSSRADSINSSIYIISLKSDAVRKRPRKKTQSSFTRLIPSGGSLAVLRKKIILEVVEKCGGVFPGDRELWFPFTTAWMAKVGRDAKPDDRTIKAAKKALVDSGRLRQLKFTFLNKNGIAVTKSIITLMEIDPTDPKVKELERQIIAHDPRHYIPEQADVDKELRNRQMADQPTEARRKDFEVEETQVELQHIPAHIRRITLNKKAAQERLAEKINNPQATPKQKGPKPRIQRLDRLKKPSDVRKVGFSMGAMRNLPPYQTRELSPSYYGDLDMVERELNQILDPELRERVLSRVRLGTNEPTDLEEYDPLMEERCRILDQLAWNHIGIGEAQKPQPKISFKEPLGLHSNFDWTPPPEPEILEIEAGQPWLLDHTLGRYKPPRNLRNRDFENTPATGSLRKEAFSSGKEKRQKKRKHVHEDSSPSKLRALPRSQVNNAFPETWEPANTGPDTYDPGLVSAIMSPDQTFHPSSGTFSTNYSVTRDARTDHWINSGRQDLEFIPQSLEQLLSDSQPGRTQPSTATSGEPRGTLEKEVDDVLDWELRNPGLANIKRQDWQFINHGYPGIQEVAEEVAHGIQFLSEDQNQLEASSHLTMGLTLTGAPRQRKPAVPKLKTRRLTSLKYQKIPTQLVLGSPNDTDGRAFKKIRTRGPSHLRYVDVEWEKRLMTAVVVVRTLVGGVELNIDWVLISNIFPPEFNEKFLHQRWTYILQKHRLQVDQLQEDFQDIFIPAYEKGLVPPLDYDNIEAYDWKWLVDWTLENIQTNTNDLPDLPIDRSRLDEQFNLRPSIEQDMFDFYEINGNVSIPFRYNIAHRDPYIVPLESNVASEPISRLEIAKSWVKSNIVTPELNYDPKTARVKLAGIGESNIESALKALLSSKTIAQENKGRLVPGRNYDISELFISRLQKNLSVGDFKNALAYKNELDDSFQKKGCAEFSYHANDGVVMAVHNLVAYKRVRIRPVDPPMNKFGLVDGEYRTRSMDKARLHFAISLSPTDTYVYGNPLLPLAAPPYRHPNDSDPASARIPIWYDINGQVIPVMWDLVLAAVLAVVVVRPGVGVLETSGGLKGALEGWEIECVMEWLVQIGVAEWLGGVKWSGVRLGEWWWMCVGLGGGSICKDGETMGG